MLKPYPSTVGKKKATDSLNSSSGKNAINWPFVITSGFYTGQQPAQKFRNSGRLKQQDTART